MKRCLQCGREYDTSMMFCLDDGAELLYGPASGTGDQPATAILHESASPDEAATREQIHTTGQTEILSSVASHPGKPRSFDKRLILAPVLLAVIVAVGFFVYRYLNSNTKQIDSIAVMPFVNESGDPELEFLTDGMTETLIKSLSAIPNLAVKARSTVFYYKGKDTSPKQVGDELSVQAVLLGRVSGKRDVLKLSLELVNTRTQDVIWTDQYEAPRSDVVSLQSTIAKGVSTTLRARLTGEEQAKVTSAPTNNPDAYQAYLKGRYYFYLRGADNLSKSIEQFKLATELDPNLALAYSGLADSYAIYSDYAGTPGSEMVPIVRMYAERAIALDPQLAEPHATLGIINVQNRNWEEALRESKKAVDLNPNYSTGVQWYASILLDTGRYDEAAEMMKRAHELDPVSPAISDGLSNTFEVRDDFDAAIENSKRYIELNPTFPGSFRNLGFYYSMMGRHAEAVAQSEKAVQLERASYLLGDLGYVYAAAGKRDQALALVRELEIRFANNRGPGRYIAEIYSGLGEKEKAMEWLEKDFQAKNGRLAEIRWTVPYRSMHDYPPFNDLLKRMGLPNRNL
jgi:TolB-like protein/tetratricopeptide (TPR) repeat protein